MDDIQKRIEIERRIAARSTYWACCCGFDHVPGCKVRTTEWIVKGAMILTGLCAFWYWVS